jgi:hypothetical protein
VSTDALPFAETERPPAPVVELFPDGTTLETDPDGRQWLRKYRGGVQRAGFVVEAVDVESLRRWVK